MFRQDGVSIFCPVDFGRFASDTSSYFELPNRNALTPKCRNTTMPSLFFQTAWNDPRGDNVLMDAITTIGTFFCFVVGCVAADWYFRGVSERRFRRGLHAEAESYLRSPKRI